MASSVAMRSRAGTSSRPVVTTMWSDSGDLPVTSIATVASALASSRLFNTTSII